MVNIVDFEIWGRIAKNYWYQTAILRLYFDDASKPIYSMIVLSIMISFSACFNRSTYQKLYKDNSLNINISSLGTNIYGSTEFDGICGILFLAKQVEMAWKDFVVFV